MKFVLLLVACVAFACKANGSPQSFGATILATEPASLTGYWKCDELNGPTLADSSGNLKPLTIVGTFGTNYFLGEAGDQGTCFRTDGVAGYAWRSDAVIPSLDNTNFTVFALFNGGLDFNAEGAVTICSSQNELSRVGMGDLKQTVQARGNARGNGLLPNPIINGGVAFDGAWHSVTYRRSNLTVFDLFVDGTKVATSSATFALGSVLNRTSLMHPLNPGNPPFGKGSIQHVAIWNTALTDNEISAIQLARTSSTPSPTPTATPTATATTTPTPTPTPTASAGQLNVTMEHNDPARDGVYVDSAFTQTAAANLHRDLNFTGGISGQVYAQPLYIEGNGAPMVIVVTEKNNVYALNAMTGAVVWSRNVGTPVSSGLTCAGNINPLGITGTPVIDPVSRALFFDATIAGNPPSHQIFSLNVDTGTTNPGWPVNVDANAQFGGQTFTATLENQRSALGLVNGVVYVGYSGHLDCGAYHGWLVGVPINNPSSVTAWASSAQGGGIWGHSGIASDGTSILAVTGNTFNTNGNWGNGEAVIRFAAGPTFSGNAVDFFAPSNWFDLDNDDKDLGGCGAILVNVPGATPSNLVIALGKDGKAYLINQSNFGGFGGQVAIATVATEVRGQAGVAYTTRNGTYFAFRAASGALAAYKITATNPPTMVPAWSSTQTGQGSPWVTTTNGTDNIIVWLANSGGAGDQRIRGFDGNTGNVIFAGGGTNELMSGTMRYNTGLVARGRIYFAGTNKVFAFTLQ